MKKLMIVLFATAGVVACTESKDIKVLQELQGTWVGLAEDGSTYATDSIFSVIFNTDMSCSIGRGAVDTEGGMQWQVDVNYTYSVDADVLTIRSTSDNDQTVYMKGSIDYLSEVEFLYNISQYTIDGVNQSDIYQYSLESANDTFLYTVFTGIWSSPVSGSDDLIEIWDFDNENNTFAYYLYNNSTSTYEESIASGGEFFIYGEYGALNLPATDTASPSYRVWMVTNTDTGEPVWYNTAEDGTITSELLTSLDSLP